MSTDTHALDVELRQVSLPSVTWRAIAPVVGLLEAAGVLCAAVLSSALYYSMAYGEPFWHRGDYDFELTVAVFYVLVRALRGDYAYGAFISAKAYFARICQAWCLAFVALLAAVFLLKVGNHYSRGMAFSLFVAGPLVLAVEQRLLSRFFISACRSGRLAVRRVFVVGAASEVAEHCLAADRGRSGHVVVGAHVLGDGSDATREARQLSQAVARARSYGPDDILVVLPLSEHARIEGVVQAFKVMPASVHLGADQLLQRFPALRTMRAGDSASLELVREPLTPFEQLAKRCFDVAFAGAALIMLAPLLAAAAAAIKLTSSGPVFYRQKRHCFNRRRFSIYKFRTMYVERDDGPFRQATRNDPRITPVGAWLRRTNIDELPQLLNVLVGDMSIVGPRPHAIAHDEDFEQRISSYARRHNIKPGITGWAQVNGLRGETDTDEKMRARVEHDLAYVDHWSMLLDLKIIALTVVSPRAYRNAV